MSQDPTALESLVQYCQENGRICPQPERWQALYRLLPETKRAGAGWEPALPLILPAWWDTPYLAKIMRLREHLEWADKHGALALLPTPEHNCFKAFSLAPKAAKKE